MPWSFEDHMISTLCQWSPDPDIKSFFASNQTSNIFYPKILHASFSVFNLPYTNFNTTSHILALALSVAKVLYVLQSQASL